MFNQPKLEQLGMDGELQRTSCLYTSITKFVPNSELEVVIYSEQDGCGFLKANFVLDQQSNEKNSLLNSRTPPPSSNWT